MNPAVLDEIRREIIALAIKGDTDSAYSLLMLYDRLVKHTLE